MNKQNKENRDENEDDEERFKSKRGKIYKDKN